MSRVKILGIRKVESRGNLRALVDVMIDDITIHDFRIIQEPGKRPWVAVPQLEIRLKDSGERYYKPLIELPRELRREITIAALEEYGHDRDDVS